MKPRLLLQNILVLVFVLFWGCRTNPLKSEVGKMTVPQATKRFGLPEEIRQLDSGSMEYSWFISTEFGSLRKQVMIFNEKGLLTNVNSYYVGEISPPMGPVFDDKFERSIHD